MFGGGGIGIHEVLKRAWAGDGKKMAKKFTFDIEASKLEHGTLEHFTVGPVLFITGSSLCEFLGLSWDTEKDGILWFFGDIGLPINRGDGFEDIGFNDHQIKKFGDILKEKFYQNGKNSHKQAGKRSEFNRSLKLLEKAISEL